MSTTISVNAALNKLKILNSRIEKVISDNLPLICVASHEGSTEEKKGTAEMQAGIDNAYQSVNALIEKRDVLKAAIMASNAVTLFKVNDKEMTVAEAIFRKSSIASKKQFISELKYNLAREHKKVETHNTMARERAVQQATELFINSDDKVGFAAHTDLVYEKLARRVITIEGGLEEVQKQFDDIEKFESQVDNALTESNVMTQVTVD